MSTEGSGASRGGGDEFHNEDAFCVEEGLGLYVVCDGASGTPAGEVAARVATEAVEEFVERAKRDLDMQSGRVARKIVEKAMWYAVSALLEAERSHPELSGLDTTVTMLLAHGSLGVIGHRGDSRAYLIRKDRAHQLTLDHEIAQHAPSDEGDDDSGIDVFAVDLVPGDTIVLCTDGAEETMERDEVVRAARHLSPRLLASRIVSAAHRRTPGVDATAVVVRVRRDLEPGWLELSSLPQSTSFGHTLPLAA